MAKKPMSLYRPRPDCSRFDEWWAVVIHKIGKIAARDAYRYALSLTDHDTIMKGWMLYIRTKPETQLWCHPSRWLEEGRWEDEPAIEGKAKPKSGLDLLTRQQEYDLYEFTKQAEPESAYMSMGQSHMRSLMHKHLESWNTL